jgi:hypothetical protein
MWFKPYSFSCRKKGAVETVRHFCARRVRRPGASGHRTTPDVMARRRRRPISGDKTALTPYSGATERHAVLFLGLAEA